MFDALAFCNIQISRSLSSTVTAEKQNVCINVNNTDLSTKIAYENVGRYLKSLTSTSAIRRITIVEYHSQKLDSTLKYLYRSGLTLEDVDKIPIIHITGSKGKGSTCVFTESILRSFGIRTGFFSSPHLISVSERYRINGKPIGVDEFIESFCEIYEHLDRNKENEDDMPAYFQFFTILCFHIFLKHNVEVGIFEVGVGGEYDCTNIVRNVKTIGITSIGLEHTRYLGDTLEKIAWHKAGIIKPKSHVFVNPLPNECIEVIKKRALEKNAKMFIASDFSNYNWSRIPSLKGYTKVSQSNAALAIELAYDWLRNYKMEKLNSFADEKVLNGLEIWYWPGRHQIVNFHNMTIHLDGAHTIESLNFCIEWFLESTKNSKNRKYFIFCLSGDRDAKKFLQILHKHSSIFTEAIFIPGIPLRVESLIFNLNIQPGIYPSDFNKEIEMVTLRADLWNDMQMKNGYKLNSNSCNSKIFGNTLEAIEYFHKNFHESNVDILVTGSLYLVGNTILALEEYDKKLQAQ